MGRGKIEMKRIEDDITRHVSFRNRKKGLFKKAYELSVLCDAEIALIIFGDSGSVSEYASNNIKSTIERYKKETSTTPYTWSSQEINAQFYQQESEKLREQIQILENTNRHLMGEGLGCLNVKELMELETRLERGIDMVKSKKYNMILAEKEDLQKGKINLEHHNAFLRSMVQILENERVQHLNMHTIHEYNALQAHMAGNALQLNIMEPIQDCSSVNFSPQKHSLHLG
ncbi:hypothetical protein OSB04_002345 [Centaurea solstitialis]|uniref:Uncharacterized protein n=1 Tax=Centaurea solstitialis TaxID=347529 RepID=A0AA38TUJ8_9ASTR|nr:hypothetical protein OSB04_002345 [Centaurea solstitialis]